MLLFDIFTPSSIFWLLFHTHNFLIRLWRWKLREAYKYMKEWKWQKATFLQMYRKWKIYILKLLPKNLNYELFSFYWQLQFLHISHFTFQIIFSFPQWHILSWVLVLQPQKKFSSHSYFYVLENVKKTIENNWAIQKIQFLKYTEYMSIM